MPPPKDYARIPLKALPPPNLIKKIGKTAYLVRVHFSDTNPETMTDKIKRMLKNEVRGL